MKPQHTMALRGLSPAALKIFLALLWNGAPMGRDDLSIHTGCSADLVSEGLKLLEALGIAHNIRRYNGWTLTLEGQQLSLPGIQVLDAEVENRPPEENRAENAPLDEPGGRKSTSPESLDSRLDQEVKDLSSEIENLDSDSQAENRPPATGPAPDVPRILAATRALFGEPVYETPNAVTHPDRLLGWIAHAHDKRDKLDAPARLIFKRLKAGKLPDREYLEDPLAYLPDFFLEAAGLIEPPAVPPGPPPEPGPGERAWLAACEQIGFESPSTREWLDRAQLLGFEDGIFTIGAANDYAREWLESRLASTINRLLTGIMNRSVVVRFVVR